MRVRGTYVHWIALIPNSSLYVLGGVVRASNNDYVRFPLRLPRIPVVVTNALWERRIGRIRIPLQPLASSAYQVSTRGFRVLIRDHRNRGLRGAKLLWIAVIPTSRNGFKGGSRRVNSGSIFYFFRPFPHDPVFVASANKGQIPLVAAGMREGARRFRILVTSYDCRAGRDVYVQWLGYSRFADLSVEDVNYPSTAIVGASFTINIKIANGGTEDVRDVRWTVQDDRSWSESGTIHLLRAGTSVSIPVNVRVADLGRRTFVVDVDPSNSIRESNEVNNRKTFSVLIQGIRFERAPEVGRVGGRGLRSLRRLPPRQ